MYIQEVFRVPVKEVVCNIISMDVGLQQKHLNYGGCQDVETKINICPYR